VSARRSSDDRADFRAKLPKLDHGFIEARHFGASHRAAFIDTELHDLKQTQLAKLFALLEVRKLNASRPDECGFSLGRITSAFDVCLDRLTLPLESRELLIVHRVCLLEKT
jgi:hypothetical protein